MLSFSYKSINPQTIVGWALDELTLPFHSSPYSVLCLADLVVKTFSKHLDLLPLFMSTLPFTRVVAWLSAENELRMGLHGENSREYLVII